MSSAIKLAVLAAAIFVVTSVAHAALQIGFADVSILWVALSVSIAVLILIGVIKGQRLAWQWGMVFGLLGAIFASSQAYDIHTIYPQAWQLTALFSTQAAALFVLFMVLASGAGKQHFRLQCPSCGSKRVKAANFLYSKAICKKCAHCWT